MKTVVVIPTYNERENIGPLLDEIVKIQENIEVLVVDDDSPDGTWRIVEDYSKKNPRIHLLRRTSERGRGLAGIAGFKYALENKADYVIEMDGDLSHDPQHIPEFLKKIENCDVVIGSRFAPSGGEVGRGFLRRLITRLAAIYVRALLGFRVTDPTSGYRCYRGKVLEAIDMRSLKAKDPFLLSEMLFRCYKKSFRIKEIPIIFRDRKSGTSKIGWKILITYLFKVIKLRVRGK
ncbi:polyprenol monophosphomannose synthase [bacterium]|nr:polyprenol monophosphomannose synthase [bacterium]MCG2677706.1 polyprenol monophosphomannose synthase [bacterium]